MAGERSRYGLVVSALGAVLLAVSVFLPWYGLSLTSAGVALAQQAGDQIASQLGGGALQPYAGEMHAGLAGLAGQQLVAVSAHQILKDLNVLLLVLAGLAMVDTLFPLARSASCVPDGAGRSVVLLGGLACACILYRMVVMPTPAGGMVALSLREGAWLALAGSLTMVLGGMWPRRSLLETRASDLLSGLSGWTPQA